MLGGVRREGGLNVSRHRRWIGGSDGRSGAAAPLTAAALWLICCGWTTHNKHLQAEDADSMLTQTKQVCDEYLL